MLPNDPDPPKSPYSFQVPLVLPTPLILLQASTPPDALDPSTPLILPNIPYPPKRPCMILPISTGLPKRR